MALIHRTARSPVTVVILALSAVLGGAGVEALAGQDTAAAPPVSASPAVPQGLADSQVVLSTMHQLNQLEMRLGQWAEENGTTGPIRRFGDRLYRDHRFGDGKVNALAHAEDLTLLQPDQLPAAPKLRPVMQKAEQLQQEEGPASDNAFLNIVIQSHEMATSMLEDALAALPAGKVRELVSRLLPILEQHLDLARAIQEERSEG